jgi:hypothetical protein
MRDALGVRASSPSAASAARARRTRCRDTKSSSSESLAHASSSHDGVARWSGGGAFADAEVPEKERPAKGRDIGRAARRRRVRRGQCGEGSSGQSVWKMRVRPQVTGKGDECQHSGAASVRCAAQRRAGAEASRRAGRGEKAGGRRQEQPRPGPAARARRGASTRRWLVRCTRRRSAGAAPTAHHQGPRRAPSRPLAPSRRRTTTVATESDDRSPSTAPPSPGQWPDIFDSTITAAIAPCKGRAQLAHGLRDLAQLRSHRGRGAKTCPPPSQSHE